MFEENVHDTVHHGQKAWFSTQRFGDWFFLQPRWWRTFWPPYLGVGSSWVASSCGPQENMDAWWAYGNLYSFVSQIQSYTELTNYQNVSKYALKGNPLKGRHKNGGRRFSGQGQNPWLSRGEGQVPRVIAASEAMTKSEQEMLIIWIILHIF